MDQYKNCHLDLVDIKPPPTLESETVHKEPLLENFTSAEKPRGERAG